MNLYKIEQSINRGYDTYDAAVVCAANEDAARMMHPGGDEDWWQDHGPFGTWAISPEDVEVMLIGVAVEGMVESVVCASFHAG